MPVNRYFAGHGEEVMAHMRKQYGKRAEEVFYATANKRKAIKRRLAKKRK